MAEGTPLLRVHRVIPIEGSNPSLSARCEKGPKGPFFVDDFGRRSCCRGVWSRLKPLLQGAIRCDAGCRSGSSRDRCRMDPGLDEVRGGKNNGELRARSSVG